MNAPVLLIEPLSTDNQILACRGCLVTDLELHDINKNDIAQMFSDFIGFFVHQSDGYPQFVCSTCLFLLQKFVRFRRKCLTAMQTLQQMKVSGDKKPRCSSCDVVFASADALGVHVNAAQGCQQGHSSCPQCGNNFSSETDMDSHYNEVHNKDEYVCEKCGKVYTDPKSYTAHTNAHHGDQNALYARKPNRAKRRRPKLNHIKNFVCEFCGKKLLNKTLLNEHQRVHTGEKPFRCDYCPKSFRIKLLMQNHIRTHTDERKFKSDVCHKAFRQRQHRIAHMVTHTKERPYPCKACPKRYTSPTNLREHVNTAHLGLPPRKRVKKD